MVALKSSTKLPTKKSRDTMQKPLTTGKSMLSTELVQSSDESDEDGLSVRNQNQESYRTKGMGVRSSQLESLPKNSSSNEKQRPKRARSSTSYSDSERSSSEQAEKKNGYEKHSRNKTNNSSQSAEESPTLTRPGVPTTRPAPAKLAPNNSSKMDISTTKKSGPNGFANKDRRADQDTTGSENSSGSEGESESDEDSDSTEGESGQIKGRNAPSHEKPPRQPPSPYQPPPGFEAVSIPFNQSSNISKIFAPSNLQGKQIWHITAPASVPLSLLKEVSAENIRDGSSVLSHRGTDYGLISDVGDIQASNKALLLPSAQSNNYRPSEIPLARTLHLQQLVHLPNHGQVPRLHANGSSKKAETRRGPYHVQPQGLKMRYHPFGVSTSSDSDSSSEHSYQAPKFRHPKPPTETPSPSKKRKHAEPKDRHQSIEATPVNYNTQTPQPDPTIDTDHSPMEIDPPQAPESQEPSPHSKKKQHHREPPPTSPPSAQPPTGKPKKDPTPKRKNDQMTTPLRAPIVPLEHFSAQLDAKQKMQTHANGSRETKEQRARRKEKKRRRRAAEGRS